MIKDLFVNNLPALGKYKRYLVALKDNLLSVRSSYSQHGEDAYIWEILQKYDLKGSGYVDIGANHPTDISNTYLLYRKGLNGIIIEPNTELTSLFKNFRRKDIVIAIGCSNTTAIMPFNISKTPVISSFDRNKDINIYKTVLLPVMRVDDALRHLKLDFINLLSIDVEGLNIEVMQGGKETISRSLLICVEFDSEEERKKIANVAGTEFEILKTFGCNLILLNKPLSKIKLNYVS